MTDQPISPHQTDKTQHDLGMGTQLVHSGRNEGDMAPFVNPPVLHASTILYPDIKTMRTGGQKWTYGRRGTPTYEALESALSALEGAAGTMLTPSGLTACTIALMALVRAGDHILITDSVYGPTRHFADHTLARMGVEVEYYPPTLDGDIAARLKPNTRAIYLEAPGSLTFEMQDLPKIAAIAAAHGAFSIIDNTWGTPLFLKPLQLGVDVVVHAATKYIVGHSDAMLGVISANERTWKMIRHQHGDLGLCAGPDDIYLGLRGLRTLEVRLLRHQESTLKITQWLESHKDVLRVLYPALPSDPGYALWRRDFAGASGLFSFTVRDAPDAAIHAFLDGLKFFGLGYSWGGFESLASYPDFTGARTAVPFAEPGKLIRLHIGLETVDDLMEDLDKGLARFAKLAG